MRPQPPTLDGVLTAIVRGRVVRLDLTDEQKRQLRDPDGRLALHVLRHHLGARAALTPEAPAEFPLTEHAFQAVARRLGHPVGIKRARRLRRRLLTLGVLEDAGSYRQVYRSTGGATGYRVPLFRAAVRAVLRLAATPQPPIGIGVGVKRGPRLRWWQHPLFGDLSGRPPPGLTRATAARMRSRDERERPGLVAACR